MSSSWTKHYVGREITGSEDNGKLKPVSRVTIQVDNDHVLTAGDDTGSELIASSPYATQEIVDALLARVKGTRYQTLTASDASMDPAAELGDGVTVDGMYTTISQIDDDGSGYVGIQAPGEAEQDEEYPTDGPLSQTFSKNLAETRSRIEKTINSITLDVTGALGGKASIELKVNDKVQTSGEVDLSKVRQSFAEDESSITISAGIITFNGNTFVVNSDNFKVSKNGIVTASEGRFERVTITSSSLGGTLNADGTFTGTHSGGDLSRTGGSFVGTHSGGSLSNTGGSFTGTHSGGSLNGTDGGYWGYVQKNEGQHGVYSGEVWYGGIVSCGTDSTSFGVYGGSLSNQNSGASLHGTSAAGLVAGSGGTVWCRNGTISMNPSGSGSAVVYGNLTCTGSKPRTMTTEHYGQRQLDACETPLPTFSDYGTAVLDADGMCYIVIDPVFAETVDETCLPTVFLTKYGDGDLWVEQVEHDIVAVRGTPGLRFSWETRYAQANAGVDRLRVMEFDYKDVSSESDFAADANQDFEFHSMDYQREAILYIEDFERSLTT